jgi:hypothetical protein
MAHFTLYLRSWWNGRHTILRGWRVYTRVGSNPTDRMSSFAVVAELADALDSGSSGVTAVEVRVLSTASLRKWLRGRASPCQGEGRGFESRLPLFFLAL